MADQFFTPVDHDPFADALGGLALGASPGDIMSGIDRIGSAMNRAGGGLMDYMRWNLRGSPGATPGEIGFGVVKSMADAGRTMTTPPVQMPRGATIDDAGFVSQGQANPADWQAFVADQRSRQNLAPSVALAMIGGGAPASERGAVGALGGRLSPLDQAEAYRAAAINRANKGLPSGQAAEGWAAKAAPVPAKGTPERSLAEFKASWEHAKDQAIADYQWSANPNLSAADRALMSDPGFVLGSGATDERLGAANLATQAEHAAAQQPGIRAYHGSPHDFERFDLSKIGTGEGAQAYGHGLYMAENEAVARQYRDQLSGVSTRVEPMELHDKTSGWIGMAIDNRTGRALERKVFPRGTPREEVQQWEDNLKAQAAPGRMYEVNINAHPDQFLDWDKPLSEQSPHVRSIYQKLTGAVDPAESAAKVKSLNDQMEALAGERDPVTNVMKEERKWMQLARERDIAWEQWNLAQSGQKFYHNLPKVTYSIRDSAADKWRASGASTLEEALQKVGGDKSRVLQVNTPGKDIATERLRQAGIPGIKYLDQGSRTPQTWVARHPQGGVNDFPNEQSARAFVAKNPEYSLEAPKPNTSNYVVFDDKLIDIIKKYGIAGLGVIPAGTNVLFPVDHDPFAEQAAPASTSAPIPRQYPLPF